jgi:predicted RND superfamily exporter protein
MALKAGKALIAFAIDRPKLITKVMVASTLLLVVLAAVPTIWAPARALLPGLVVDTDPENMLPHDDPVRVFHDAMRKTFAFHDVIVVGVVNNTHPEGVFNKESLRRVYELGELARTLRWPNEEDPARPMGVIEIDIFAPSLTDNIEQAGLGAVSFDWLLPRPPETEEEALAVRERAQRLRMYADTLVSGDGKAVAIYLPLTAKDMSFRVRNAVLEATADWKGTGDEVHIAGLPVAEDVFGVEMFIQMAIAAPLAMVVIFLAMWVFFRKITLILSPLIIAMVCSMATMALLVISGSTVHIMSSMIPVFIMPIAVLDSVHVISGFFDQYRLTGDRRKTMIEVMDELFVPMLVTSLTTIAGFSSLVLTPIPPVQVFGVFVAVGVFLAWLWTMLFVPAYIMMIPERHVASLAVDAGEAGARTRAISGGVANLLVAIGRWTTRRPRLIIGVAAICALASIWGMSVIVVNDNPAKWFAESHPIRIADRVLNDHFAGTYMANLHFAAGRRSTSVADEVSAMSERADAKGTALAEQVPGSAKIFDALEVEIGRAGGTANSRETLIEMLVQWAEAGFDAASDDEVEAWDEALQFLDRERQRDQVMKDPDVLRYIAALQAHLEGIPWVGKTNSVADIVKTVHRELLLGEDKEYRIPDSADAVAQTLITYESSHKPQFLWHFVTPDFRQGLIWLQLTSGDNRDMKAVAEAVDAYIAEHPPPRNLETDWFGLTYVNVVWQEKMVTGMIKAFLGSFVVVLIMMVIMFRSLIWGALSMIPLLVSIAMLYGLMGAIGKDFDMPIAVLSSLSLGLAIDYAIHFLARFRAAHNRLNDFDEAISYVFGEPARAITRTAVILGIGFTPLLLSNLVPYNTVGLLMAGILVFSAIATLLLLPAILTVIRPMVFRNAA